MVNVGRRSQGCFACRERHQKCDLEKPYCRRCIHGKRPCPGYPDAWEVMHREQNAYAENRVQTRVEKVKQWRRGQVEMRAVSIPQTVYTSAEAHSLTRFYTDYAMNSGITLIKTLPAFYANNSLTCFQEALQAVALASSARQLHQFGLMTRARWHYSKAIVALNVALDDPVMIADDSLLLTTFLFSLFEVIVVKHSITKVTNADFQCHPHFRGGLLLLQWRAERGLDTRTDKSLLAFFCHVALMSLFINYEPCTAMWPALEKFTAPWAIGPILEPVIRRAVDYKMRVRAEITAIGHHLSRAEAIQLIKSGIDICEDLETVAISVNSSSNPDLPSDQQLTAFNNLFATSTKTTEAIARALYRTIRFHIIELVSGLLAIVKETNDGASNEFEPKFELSEGIIVLEQICEGISIVFGFDGKHETQENPTGMAYRALGMFWPMAIVLFSSFAEEAKRVWVKEKLRYVGEITGYGLATLAVRTVNMPVLF